MTVQRALLLALLTGCHSLRPTAHNGLGDLMAAISGPLASDRALLVRLAQAHPCTHEALTVRTADSLSADVRCTLLTTALAAIEARRGAPEVFANLPAFHVAEVRCASLRTEAYRNIRTGEIEMARWSVELFSDHQPSLAVEIDRITGRAQTFRVLEEFGFTTAQLCARAT